MDLQNKYRLINFFFIIAWLLFIVLSVKYKSKRKPDFKVEIGSISSPLRRLSAYFIDIVICLLIYHLFYTLLKQFSIIQVKFVEETVLFIILWGYFGAFESSNLQATVGKIILGIKVSKLGTQKVSFYIASVRFLLTILSDMCFFAGHLLLYFTKNKQTFHDLITDTIVLRKNKTQPRRSGPVDTMKPRRSG